MQPLIVPGRLDSLEKIRKYIMQAAKKADLEKARVYKLSLAVDEIATNIINYGYQRAGLTGEITIEADLDENSLTITLDDTAGYFDPTLKPPPPPEDFTQPLDERAIGGWGVYLALQSVDRFHYQRFEGHNKNIFIMYRATHGNLLVIDSFQESCALVAQHLSGLGYTVTCLENHQKAIELMHQQSYELVLLRLPMQNSSAEEFVRDLKADNALRNVPIFMLVAPEKLDEAVRCIKSGAEDYVVLPFNPVVLESRVSAILERLRVRIAEQTIKDTMKYERDRQIGRMIQLYFLPEMLPQPDGWEIAARFEPASEVSGDFYDAFILPNNAISLIMGDVGDKGITAALFISLVRSLLRAFTMQEFLAHPEVSSKLDSKGGSKHEQSISSHTWNSIIKNALELTNSYILNNHDPAHMVVKIFFGILEPSSGKLRYINAGYEPAVIIHQGEVTNRLEPKGSAIGMMAELDNKIRLVQLEPGDTLLIYSDGVVEAKDPSGQAYGREELLKILGAPNLSVITLLDQIQSTVYTHIAEAAQVDDITMLAVRRLN